MPMPAFQHRDSSVAGSFIGRLLGVAAATLLLVSAPPARADIAWNVPAGDWSVATCWSGDAVPTAGAGADVFNGGTAAVSTTGDACSSLLLGNTTGSGAIQMTGGSLAVGTAAYVGYSGTGNFLQLGGACTVSGQLYVGDNGVGTYTLTGTGTLTATGQIVVGSYNGGRFQWFSNTSTLSTPTLSLGQYGTLAMGFDFDVGALTSGALFHGSTFNGGSAILEISNGATATQAGGAAANIGTLTVGTTAGSGTYSLSAGQLSAQYDEFTGYAATGNFTQSGGTNAISDCLYVGYYSDGSGTYNLSGTGTLSAYCEYVGYSGAGSITQTGGANTITSNLFLGYGANSNGAYSLSGGTLILSGIVAGSGTAAFDFGGGTLQAGGSFNTTLPMTLTGSGGNATVDTAGYRVTLSGSLSGPGGLTKTDSGTLLLAAANTYAGGTAVNGGTLSISNSSALGSGGLSIGPQGLFNLNAQNCVLPSLSGSTGGVLTDLATSAGTTTLTVSSASSASSNYAGTIRNGANRTLSLVVCGSAALILSGANTYTGNTSVQGGVLIVDGSLGSGGNVSVGAAATLSGSGSVGNVSLAAGGTIAPGVLGSGTLTAASVAVNSGSILDYWLGAGNGADGCLAVTGSLTLGSSVTVEVTPGGLWRPGTYVLATASLAIVDNSNKFSGWTLAGTGLGNDPYSFALSGNNLDLNVGGTAAVSGTWTASGGGSWNTPGNWMGSNMPTSEGDTALFGTAIGASSATVTMDGSHTLSALAFSTTGGGRYTINNGSGGTLALCNGASAVALSVSGGNQTIAVPVALGSNLAVTATTGSSLTVSGSISGTGQAISFSGGGVLVLSGPDTYTGGTTVSGGTLDFANPAAVPTTGILNVGRSGSVDLTSLLAASAPAGDGQQDPVSDMADADAAATTSPASAGVSVAAGSGGEWPGGADSTIAAGAAAAAVPEPSAFALLGAALLGLLVSLLRRNRHPLG